MRKKLFTIRAGNYPEALLESSAACLEEGGILIHPTETVHGYGCRYDNPEAVRRIRKLKGREADKPLILLIPDRGWIEILCQDVPEIALRLAGLFWPGPLTLVFNASAKARSAGGWIGATVALRQCAHPFTSRLLSRVSLPIVSTSLNRTGEPVPRDAGRFTEVLFQNPETAGLLTPGLAVIDEVLDGTGRKASTILSVTGEYGLRLIREGGLPVAEIAEKSGIRPILPAATD